MVIPAFNESKRMGYIHLAMMEFKRRNYCAFEVILVNDGSTDDTLEKLELLKNRWLELGIRSSIVNLEMNSGKGNAIKQGVEKARHDYILTLDFDMSSDPIHLTEWLTTSEMSPDQQTIYIGNKWDKDSRVNTLWYHKVFEQVFHQLQSIATGLPYPDTLCSFKLYPREIAQTLFRELKSTGWGHDVEILYRATKRKIPVKSLPVVWQHRRSSHDFKWIVRIVMLYQVFKIKSIVKEENLNAS